MNFRFFSACVLACALATVVACGKSNPVNPTSDVNGATAVTNPTGGGGAAGTGKLRVTMKDGPFVEASAVLVRISEISVHTSEDGWQPLTLDVSKPGASLTCNLTALASADDLLGLATLPAGHYTQIRLTVDDATLYLKPQPDLDAFLCGETAPVVTETATPLVIPSGVIKINHQFTIGANATTTIKLDFEADKSVHKTGNGKYQMSPVISVVSTTTTPE